MENKIKLAIQGGEKVYQSISIEKVSKVAKEQGIEFLQLWYLGPYHNIPEDGVSEVQEILEKYKLGVSVVSSWTRLNLPGDVGPAQRIIMETMDLAQRLDTRFIATYFGPNRFRDEKTAIETYQKNIAPCLEKAARMGVTVLMENEFDHLNEDPTQSDVTRTAEGILNLIETVDSPYFKITFDPANFYYAGGEPYPYAYELLKDHIAYVHLKDVRSYSERLMQEKKYYVFSDGARAKYLSVPLGEGAINYEALLQRMQEDGYDGFFVIESMCLDEQYGEFYKKAVDYLRGKGIH